MEKPSGPFPGKIKSHPFWNQLHHLSTAHPTHSLHLSPYHGPPVHQLRRAIRIHIPLKKSRHRARTISFQLKKLPGFLRDTLPYDGLPAFLCSWVNTIQARTLDRLQVEARMTMINVF
ncbi:hypothetical protein CC2G_011556 [Coprinopsis cinerea AmutBmut pab1-1]|nr:hypothetical protein CC2G_011556 [Coprinopsis cinerea AmutBmut pab1-1]